MRELASGAVEPVLAESYLAPGLPLRMHRQDQLLIYEPPLVGAAELFSWRGMVVALAVMALITAGFWRFFRALEGRGPSV